MSYLVSIVTPIYNTGSLLVELYDCLKEQSYTDFEWIIVDDGSTDAETLAILDEIEDDADFICLIKTANSGAPAARNRGMDRAKGRYLKFLDGDDLIPADHLESQVQNIRSLATSGVVVSPQKILSDFDNKKQVIFSNELKTQYFNAPLLNSLKMFEFHHSGCLYHTEFIRDHVRWDETLKAYQDLDFLWNVMLSGAEFKVDNSTWFTNREHDYTQRITLRKSAGKWNSRFEAVCKIYRRIEHEEKFDSRYLKNILMRMDRIIAGAFVEFPEAGKELLRAKKEISGKGISMYMIRRYIIGLMRRFTPLPL